MNWLEVKHFVVTSPLAGMSKRITSWISRPSEWRYPELRALYREDQALFDLLPSLLRKDAHCLDIGAHIGSFAYQLSKLAPDGSLTMIEALPHKAALLRNRFPNATVHEVAVSSTDGIATFYENLDQSGFSSLANRASRGRTVQRQVPMTRIDSLLRDAHVDFIKIDVEGFEYPALEGAAGLISRNLPTIVFEAGATIDSDFESGQGDDLFNLLTRTHGYRVWPVAEFLSQNEPLDLAAFRRCRTYPFQAFNFVALHPQAANGPNPNEVPQ